MTGAHDFSTPEGRLAAVETLGAEAYDAAFQQYRRDTVLETVNGYGIRAVNSRFGRLFAIDGLNVAYRTIEQARDHARAES